MKIHKNTRICQNVTHRVKENLTLAQYTNKGTKKFNFPACLSGKLEPRCTSPVGKLRLKSTSRGLSDPNFFVPC